MAKPDRVYDLERRQKCLEDELTRALSCYPDDDPMIGDLKRRLLHLSHELARQRRTITERHYLH
jgi:hypothetical protein